MSKKRIAIPSSHPGGLDAELGQHFGHCDLYTLVDVEGGTIKTVSTLPSVPHVQGGCLAPVNHLAQEGVDTLIAGGMGLRPLMGFNQAGIQVYYGAGLPSVKRAVEAYLQGALEVFSQENTCGGGKH